MVGACAARALLPPHPLRGSARAKSAAEITNINIKVLVDAGWPWEAAAAVRMLHTLALLHWEGSTIRIWPRSAR